MISHDAHRDGCRQGFSQADEHLIFKLIAVVLAGGFIHREPHQRGGPALSGQQRQHDRGLAVGVELGPVQGDVDAGARSYDVTNRGGAVRRLYRSRDWTAADPPACLIARLVTKPRARAKPCPIVLTAREAVSMTPSVALLNDRTRLA